MVDTCAVRAESWTDSGEQREYTLFKEVMVACFQQQLESECLGDCKLNVSVSCRNNKHKTSVFTLAGLLRFRWVWVLFLTAKWNAKCHTDFWEVRKDKQVMLIKQTRESKPKSRKYDKVYLSLIVNKGRTLGLLCLKSLACIMIMLNHRFFYSFCVSDELFLLLSCKDKCQ